jgi:hypothetical protein
VVWRVLPEVTATEAMRYATGPRCLSKIWGHLRYVSIITLTCKTAAVIIDCNIVITSDVCENQWVTSNVDIWNVCSWIWLINSRMFWTLYVPDMYIRAGRIYLCTKHSVMDKNVKNIPKSFRIGQLWNMWECKFKVLQVRVSSYNSNKSIN